VNPAQIYFTAKEKGFSDTRKSPFDGLEAASRFELMFIHD
jgi:hypothetical protein